MSVVASGKSRKRILSCILRLPNSHLWNRYERTVDLRPEGRRIHHVSTEFVEMDERNLIMNRLFGSPIRENILLDSASMVRVTDTRSLVSGSITRSIGALLEQIRMVLFDFFDISIELFCLMCNSRKDIYV
jgi:hypothetical protein